MYKCTVYVYIWVHLPLYEWEKKDCTQNYCTVYQFWYNSSSHGSSCIFADSSPFRLRVEKSESLVGEQKNSSKVCWCMQTCSCIVHQTVWELGGCGPRWCWAFFSAVTADEKISCMARSLLPVIRCAASTALCSDLRLWADQFLHQTVIPPVSELSVVHL